MNSISSRARPLTTAAAALAALVTLWGCTRSDGQPEETTSPPTPASSAGTDTAPESSPSTAGAPGDAADVAAPNDASRMLQQKIVPPEATAKQQARNQELLAAATATAGDIVKAVESGDVEALKKLLISQEAFDASVAPAYKTILGNSLLAENEKVAERLVSTLGGKKIDDFQWKPGPLGETRTQGVFKSEIPHVTQSVLAIETEGLVIEVDVQQLLYVDGRWQIFQLSLP